MARNFPRPAAMLLVAFAAFSAIALLDSDVSATEWSEVLGGSGSGQNDDGRCALMTSDGGSITVGFSDSFGAGGTDLWMVKLGPAGDIEWEKEYGGSGSDYGIYGEQTSDGGYIVCGNTDSFEAVNADGWVLKLSASGAIDWQYRYGGPGYDYLVMIQPVSGGGYVAVGYTTDWGVPYTSDLWVLELDSSGAIMWQKVYGGPLATDLDDANDFMKFRLTPDGGYVVISTSNSFSGDATYDGWVVKLTASGGIDWGVTFGGEHDDFAKGIDLVSGGGYVVSGSYVTNSSQDGWVLKLNASGGITWQRRFTYGSWDYSGEFNTIRATIEGGFIAAGDTWDSGGNVDAWLMKLAADGAVTWQKGYDSGVSWDTPYTVQQAPDGGYLTGGVADFFASGFGDYWVMRTDDTGAAGASCTSVYTMTWTAASFTEASVTASPVLKDPNDMRSTPDATGATVTGTSAQFAGVAPSGFASNDAADLDPCADTGVEITWADPANWGDGGLGTRTFDVLRDGSDLVTGLAATVHAYTDLTGTNNVLYDYSVRANNGCASAVTTGSTAQDAVGAAPSGLANNAASDLSLCAYTGVQVTWADPSDWGDGGTGTRTFDVLRNGSDLITGLAATVHAYTDTTGTHGTSYPYSIRANNGCALSAATGGASAADNDFTPSPAISGDASNTCPSLTVTLSTQTGMSAYQWYRGGEAISGANASTYAAAQTGSYTVSYTESHGCSATSPAHAVTIQTCAVKPVPDGRLSGTPVSGLKLSDTSLRVTFDALSCPTSGASTNILYGNLADLGTYTLSGSVCGIGSSGSYDWTSVSAGNLFWILVAQAGTKESSWGEKYTGGTYSQRSAAASGRCGASEIDTTAACP